MAKPTLVPQSRLLRRCAAAAVLLCAAAATPALASATTRPAASRPAVFRVGAATVTINPHYPVYLGGYGGGPAGGTIARHVDPLTGQPENVEVRAIAIAAGSHVVELARVDAQGYFAGYLEGPYGIEDVRRAAASYLRTHGMPQATSTDIVVSADHEHAVPTVLGIWGPYRHQQPYLQEVAAGTERALAEAWRAARPATLRWGTLNAPFVADETLGQPNADEGWPVDGSLLALQARDARTGATIATYVTQPGYPNIVYGPADLLCPAGTSHTLISTDFPGYAQKWIEDRLGGTALIAVGTLANQPGPMQGDSAPSPDLPPVDGCRQTRGFDDAMHMGTLIGSLTLQALGHAHPIDTPTVAAAEQYLVSPVTNPALAVLNDVAPVDDGQPWNAAGNPGAYPIDRSTSPPYDLGAAFGTWVTGVRLGHLLLLTLPGEFSAAVHDTWDQAITGAAGVFVVGAAQDFLGYDYPVYNYPAALYSADEQLFNPSLTLGDQVTDAGERIAQALGFTARLTAGAEATAPANDYSAITRPGVQLIAFPTAGDLQGGGFTTVLDGFSEAARVQRSTVGQTMSPLRWRLGDGGTATTASGEFFRHTYTRPGVYQVSVQATSSDGQTATFTLPVTVYPALTVTVERQGNRLVAVPRGGSGQVDAVQWVGRGGRVANGASVPAGPWRSVRVVDSTGTVVSVAVR